MFLSMEIHYKRNVSRASQIGKFTKFMLLYQAAAVASGLRLHVTQTESSFCES